MFSLGVTVCLQKYLVAHLVTLPWARCCLEQESSRWAK